MAEMILPGTYIEVRAEGLIAPGPISISNVGIVGTARRGKLASEDDPTSVYTPSNMGEAREIFGQYDAYDTPLEAGNPLTLIRAMELAFANGATRVFAARVAQDDADAATYSLPTDGGDITLEAVAPGTGYNGATITTGPYSLGLGVQVSGAGGGTLESVGNLPQDPDDFATQLTAASRLFSAANNGGDADIAVGATGTLATPGEAPTPAVLTLSAGTGTIDFTAKEAGEGVHDGTSIIVAAGTAPDNATVTIDDGAGTVETFEEVPRDPDDFAAALSDSELFDVANIGGDADVADQTTSGPDTDGTDGEAAVFTIPAGSGQVELTALSPGAGANDWEVGTHGYLDVNAELNGMVESWRDVPSDVAAFAEVLAGIHPSYNYSLKASTGAGSDLFTLETGGVTGNVNAEATATQTGDGSNGAAAGPDDYADGLAVLAREDVHIVVMAGQGLDMSDVLVAHVDNASTDLMKRERIGVIGSNPSARRSDLIAPAQDTGRLVFVGPGIKVFDAVANREVTLPGTYTAAAVAGRISSLDPHGSPTNKTINARGLQTKFNGTELEQLVLNRVLALEMKLGSIRIVRGITTSSNTAWAQITTRRIVDYARFGVRAAADPFIGKLNNDRVRQALKGSINNLLADMIDREMLISYELEVSATRAQQIRGIVQVTMVLRPTFSIDYIRVIMYLE